MFYMKKSIENNSDEFSPFQRKWLWDSTSPPLLKLSLSKKMLWYFWRMVLILLKVFCDLNIIKRKIHPPSPKTLSFKRKCCGIFWRMVLILLKVFCDLNIIKRKIHPPFPKLSLSKKMLWYFWRMVLILLKVFCGLNIINRKIRSETCWLKIRVMFQGGAICLPANCWYSELVLWLSISACWLSTKWTSS